VIASIIVLIPGVNYLLLDNIAVSPERRGSLNDRATIFV
jgi:hypothetical protein